MAYAVDVIDEPVTLVGHSMGALVIQRYLEQASAQAAIFLAPVPSTGTASSAANLALQYPAFFQAVDDTINGRFSEANNDLMAKIYFSPKARGDEILRFLPMVSPESNRAVVEMTMLHMRPWLRRASVPALVIGGEEDVVFPASQLFFTALPWRAEVLRVPGAGHMLPLDVHWETVAGHMLDWMERKVY